MSLWFSHSLTEEAYATFAESECPEGQGLKARSVYALLSEPEGHGAKRSGNAKAVIKTFFMIL